MAQKLVRARAKKAEHLPEWAKCCATRIEAALSEGDITLDISETSGEDGLTCIFCGSACPNDAMGRDIADNRWVHLAEYDLDEGPAEAHA